METPPHSDIAEYIANYIGLKDQMRIRFLNLDYGNNITGDICFALAEIDIVGLESLWWALNQYIHTIPFNYNEEIERLFLRIVFNIDSYSYIVTITSTIRKKQLNMCCGNHLISYLFKPKTMGKYFIMLNDTVFKVKKSV
jgi:hypothetical protein